MKTYIITRTAEGVKLHAKTDGKAYEIRPPRSQAIRREASGYEFGFHGAAPAQLALAILLDCFEHRAPSPENLALDHYRDFRDDFIAREVGESFEIDEKKIVSWHGERTTRTSGSYLGS